MSSQNSGPDPCSACSDGSSSLSSCEISVVVIGLLSSAASVYLVDTLDVFWG